MTHDAAVECPGCNTPMTACGITGNYRQYKCNNNCAITIEQPLTTDLDGLSIEGLQSINTFNNSY